MQPDDIRALGATLTSQRFAGGEPIHPAGAPSSRAYIVEDGEIELHVRRRRTRILNGGDARERLAQAEMAALLGATRQSVNRALAALAEDGLVTTEYGGLTDAERLMSLTGQALDVH